MRYEELTSDQQKKIAACQTPEEVLALAKESGYTLTDDELAEVASGGGAWGGGRRNKRPLPQLRVHQLPHHTYGHGQPAERLQQVQLRVGLTTPRHVMQFVGPQGRFARTFRSQVRTRTTTGYAFYA